MTTTANPACWLASDEALQQIAAIAGAPLRRGHHVRVLRDGGLAFPAMLALIRAARRAVCFENFIFAGDATGEEFARGLERAHARGVKVRVLYDPIGTMLVRGGSIRRRLQASDLEVRAFRPLSMTAPWSWFRLRHRDHRKVLIADDIGAVVGGLCIADHWSPAERGGGGWRDTALLVRGPAVADLQLAFERMWRRAVDLMPDSLRPTRTAWPTANLPPDRGDAAVIVVGDRPRTVRVAALYEWLAARAEETIEIADAYPVTTPKVLKSLIAAVRRGVQLRLLVPGRSNHPLAGLAARRIYGPLLEAGAEIWEWSGVMLHAKTAVVDGVISLVGSSNLDPLSLYRNYELNLVVGCPRTGTAMRDLFASDITQARRLTLEEWNGRPPLFKLGERLAALFAWNL
jgi:cardiolipin synthase A/B